MCVKWDVCGRCDARGDSRSVSYHIMCYVSSRHDISYCLRGETCEASHPKKAPQLHATVPSSACPHTNACARAHKPTRSCIIASTASKSEQQQAQQLRQVQRLQLHTCASLARPMPIFSRSAFDLGSMAILMTGSGKSMRSRMMGAFSSHSVSPGGGGGGMNTRQGILVREVGLRRRGAMETKHKG